ncbi:helix-turn-helix domain-containing protein [Bifidobacterium primatium]|nr:AraC family transcriptional regulator [Bifidobacterium primatium]
MTTAYGNEAALGKEAGDDIAIGADIDFGKRERDDHAASYMSPGDELVRHALAYIDRNICTPIDVASVARAVNVNRSYLSRTFHACVGMTAKAYIDARRIERATTMLTESNMSIARVARRCGYASADVFTRRFRAAHNTTPAQWRRGQRP